MNTRFTLLLMALCLSACSPDGQDDGGGSVALVPIKASAEFGSTLVGALAFVDLNNNGVLDSFEPTAITDGNGETATDSALCTGIDPAPTCLLVTDPQLPLVVRVQGGFERSTGARYRGQVATLIEEGTAPIPILDATPGTPQDLDLISALQAELDTPEKRAALEDALRPGDELRLSALLAALLGKIDVDLDAADENPDQLGEIAKATQAGAAQLLIGDAESVAANQPQSTADLATNPELLRGLLAKVLGTGNTKLLDPLANEIADVGRLVLAAVDTFAQDNPSLGQRRAAQLLVSRAARSGFIQSAIQRDSAYFTAPGEDDSPQALIAALNSGDFDLDQLLGTPLAGDGAELAQGARIPASAARLSALGGQQVDVARNLDGIDARAIVYFEQSGSLRLCIRYREQGEQSGFATEGTLLRGRWTVVDDFTVSLALNLLGARRSATLRSVGQQRYRFDYDGDFEVFTGPAPSMTNATLPNTSSDCRARL